MPLPPSSLRPRIVVLLNHEIVRPGPSPLAQIVQEVMHEYAGRADITVIDKELSQFLSFARQLQDAQDVDAFVCTGTAGAFLRRHLSTPVALMRENGFDLLAALNEAAQIADRVAVFTRDRVQPELGAAASLLNIQIVSRIYTGRGQVREMADDVAASGIRVVIGSSMVTEYVRQAGLAGILSTSRHSARQALDDALAFCQRVQAESARKQQLDTMLAHVDEGIVALDRLGAIQAINPAMTRLLHIAPEQALGRPLQEVIPVLAQLMAAEDGAGDYRMVNVGNRSLVVSRFPVITQGVNTGTILKCQDTETVERADRRIRSSRRPGRFTARYHLYQILGESSAIRTAARLAEQYARTNSTVLVTGESGTGKELLAQGIHNASPRRDGPFVAINCAALPETLLESELFGYEEGAFSGSRKGGKPGLFELAHTGTIFLDEIGDMPLSLQTRLLRVLQEQEVLRLGGTEPTPINVRIIAATHRDLTRQIGAGAFREDLYYRINILRLYAPPLRERPEDIPELARHLVQQVSARLGLKIDRRALMEALLPAMTSYAWPGNVRELENIIERAVVSLSAAPPRTLPEHQLRHTVPELFSTGPSPAASRPSSARGLRAHLSEVAAEQARRALLDAGGNHDEAARALGISRSTLWRRLKQKTR